MSMDGAEIVRQYQARKTARALFDWRWEEMAPFICPSRIGIRRQLPVGAKQTRNVYDSTTMVAAEQCAHFIAGHIINPSQRWFGLAMADPRVRDSDPVREWLEECRDRMLTRLAQSMFYAEAPESLIDFVGFGTGDLLVEENPQPVNRTVRGFRGFRFEAVKTGRFVIAEGPDGLVDVLQREYTLSARQIQAQWGADPQARLPAAVTRAIAEQHVEQPFTLLHSIEPRPTAQRGAGALGMPWASVWVELADKQVLREGGYPVFPASVPRYQKTPGEVYGRGRGDLAFPDAWTLNSAKRMGFEDWALKIRPPVLQAHDSVIGTLRLTPGAPTSVNLKMGRSLQDSIMPFQTGSHPEVSQIKEEELRRSIREIFFVDAIRQLLTVEKSEMTAFEFAKKIELLFRLMGPVYGRTEREWLHRIIDACFALQFAAGDFPPPPPEVWETDGAIVTEFQNPLAKAQRSGDAESLAMAFNDLAPLGQVQPQVWDWIDADKTVKGVFEIRGVPAVWTRSDDEVAALRAARQQQNETANDLAAANQIADSMGKAAPLVKALQPAAAPQGTA